ncbi:MAG TPA: DUF1697 domain-containing protein [Bryobacteraceae bacterium]|jgi:uncharacterized protein (DUF1697 family)|nr:DUF1697 domain-containing protein [Bryobacteraceae bacterium]
MKSYLALLRAVNVGGTGLLSMKELAALAAAAGFHNARTFIQSGNLLFESDLPKAQVRERLAEALRKKMGRDVGVMLREPPELQAILKQNPFQNEPPAKVAVIFLPGPVDHAAFRNISGPAGEQVHARGSEVYVYYPDGMGRSKLKLPREASEGTARNINTVTKLLALSASPTPPAKKASKNRTNQVSTRSSS